MADLGVPVLVVAVHDWRCALDLRDVLETLRPLPVQPVPGAPDYVRGLAVIRGQAMPVVDLAALLTGLPEHDCERFVCVRSGGRWLALAVAAVLGIHRLGVHSLQDLPPLLAQARGHGLESLGLLDRELLSVLATGRLLPEAVWQQLQDLAVPA